MGDIYVTGSKGFIGKHLMAALPDAIPVDPKEARCESPDDTVIHLANRVSRTFGEYLSNVKSMGAMLTRSVDGGKIVYLSSSVVYMKELSLYKTSKISCELLCQCSSDRLNISVIRPFNVFGPGQPDQFVIPTIIKQMLANEEPIRVKNVNAQRTFVYVEDLVKAIINVDQKLVDFGYYYYSINDIYLEICQLMDKYPEIVSEKESRDNGPQPGNANGFNYTPISEALAKTIEHYKKERLVNV